MKRLLLSAAYLSCIPLANWLIGHVGACVPNGPCLIPVGLGLMAPSGVIVIGGALCLRDAVQELLGVRRALLLTATGALLSAVVAPRFALASAVAFAISEGLDALAFSRVRRWGLAPAVMLSGVLGLLVDSAIFLGLAFGSLEHLWGQALGKAWAVLAASLVVCVRSSLDTPSPFRQGG